MIIDIYWIYIPGYEGYYQASNTGEVRSVDRMVFGKGGSPKKISGKVLSQHIDKDGYCIVSLHKDGCVNTVKVHRLVGMTFLDNYNNYPEINHRNAVKNDNNVFNLEWCDAKHNTNHAIEKGLKNSPQGEKHYNSKLKDTDITKIRDLYSMGKYTYNELGKLFNVTQSAIGYIITGKRWAHIN
ncbi:MAG: NUMOD4 domain-containing protein [Candidatus Neomarinimicrobiota bacterium]